jgi:hypothetical protein
MYHSILTILKSWGGEGLLVMNPEKNLIRNHGAVKGGGKGTAARSDGG